MLADRLFCFCFKLLSGGPNTERLSSVDEFQADETRTPTSGNRVPPCDVSGIRSTVCRRTVNNNRNPFGRRKRFRRVNKNQFSLLCDGDKTRIPASVTTAAISVDNARRAAVTVFRQLHDGLDNDKRTITKMYIF